MCACVGVRGVKRSTDCAGRIRTPPLPSLPRGLRAPAPWPAAASGPRPPHRWPPSGWFACFAPSVKCVCELGMLVGVGSKPLLAVECGRSSRRVAFFIATLHARTKAPPATPIRRCTTPALRRPLSASRRSCALHPHARGGDNSILHTSRQVLRLLGGCFRFGERGREREASSATAQQPPCPMPASASLACLLWPSTPPGSTASISRSIEAGFDTQKGFGCRPQSIDRAIQPIGLLAAAVPLSSIARLSRRCHNRID